MPLRGDLTRASWLNPANSFAFNYGKRRREFIAKYSPVPQHGLPPAPPPPGALRPLPLPGEDIPAHRVRLKNLPMACTLEMLQAYLGKHAGKVMEWDRDGYRGGVLFDKREDGSLTGECVVKFESKRAAMYALVDIDRGYMGKKLIFGCYEVVPAPADRGRLKLLGLPSKTSVRDVTVFFSGWLLAPEADGHDPELLLGDEGEPTGEAVVTFMDVEASDHALVQFDWGGKRVHGAEVSFEPMTPITWDEVAEKWSQREVIAPSTLKVLSDQGWI